MSEHPLVLLWLLETFVGSFFSPTCGPFAPVSVLTRDVFFPSFALSLEINSSPLSLRGSSSWSFCVRYYFIFSEYHFGIIWTTDPSLALPFPAPQILHKAANNPEPSSAAKTQLWAQIMSLLDWGFPKPQTLRCSWMAEGKGSHGLHYTFICEWLLRD